MRQNMAEFRGRAKAARWMRHAVYPLLKFIGGRTHGRLTGIATRVQSLDRTSKQGERPILFSKYGQLLEGFELNPEKPLDRFLKKKVTTTIDRTNCTARISIPASTPALPKEYSCFRLVASLAVLSDFQLKNKLSRDSGYTAMPGSNSNVWAWKETGWLTKGKTIKAQALDVKLSDLPDHDTHALVLALGIQFGKKDRNGDIIECRDGAGRILSVGCQEDSQ
jgi:hypothetical protein